MVPALLLHLVYREEQCRGRWLRNGVLRRSRSRWRGAMAGVDAGLLPGRLGRHAGVRAGAATGRRRTARTVVGGPFAAAARSSRSAAIASGCCVLLCLMLQTSAATVLLQLSPAVTPAAGLPAADFLWRHALLQGAPGLLRSGVEARRVPGLFAAGAGDVFPGSPGAPLWGQWLLLAPLWLAAPLDLRTAGAHHRSRMAAPPLHGRGGGAPVRGRGAGGRKRGGFTRPRRRRR